MQILSATVRGMARPPGRGDLSTVMPRFITNLGLSTSYFPANRKSSCTVEVGDMIHINSVVTTNVVATTTVMSPLCVYAEARICNQIYLLNQLSAF